MGGIILYAYKSIVKAFIESGKSTLQWRAKSLQCLHRHCCNEWSLPFLLQPNLSLRDVKSFVLIQNSWQK